MYYGWFVWSGNLHKGVHKPLISKLLYDKVQSIMHRLAKAKSKRSFTYSGVMKCFFCGCTITAEIQKGHVYYHCTKNRGQCPNAFVREEVIEDEILKMLEGFEIDQGAIEVMMEDFERKAGEDAVRRESQIALMKQEVVRTRNRIDAAYNDKLDGKITDEFWQMRSRKWQEEIATLEAKIKELECTDPSVYVVTLRRLIELTKDLKNQYKQMLAEKKCDLLKMVCSNLQLKHKSLSFSYTNPFDIFAETVTSGNWGGFRNITGNHLKVVRWLNVEYIAPFDPSHATIGIRLRYLRRMAGVTIAQLATLSGICLLYTSPSPRD